MTWSYDPAENRLSQDWTQSSVRTVTNWAYDAVEQLATETVGSAATRTTMSYEVQDVL